MNKLVYLSVSVVLICSMASAEDVNLLDPFSEENRPAEAQGTTKESSKTPTNIIVMKAENAVIGHYGNYVPLFIGYEKNPTCVLKISDTSKCFKDIHGPNTETIDMLSIMSDEIGDTSLAKIIIGKSVLGNDTDSGIQKLYKIAKRKYLKFSKSHKTVEKIIVEDTSAIWDYLRMSDIYLKCQYAVYSYHYDSGNKSKAKKIEPEIEKIKKDMTLAERVLQSLK